MGTKEKEFNTILDECLDRMLFMGETPEQCLASYPQFADELRPLLDAAVMTNRVSELEPDPAFKSRARGEFLSVVRETGSRKKSSFFSFEWLYVQRRVAVSIMAVLVVLIGLGGTAAASMNSMPNDFLYPVKRATEQVQLAFTFTSLGKAEAYARLADTRVDEIVYMAGLNDGTKIEMLASSLNSNLINIAAISDRNNTNGVTSEEAAQSSLMSAASDESVQSAPTAKSFTESDAASAGGAATESAPVMMQALDTGGNDTSTNDTAVGITAMAAPTATPEVTSAAPLPRIQEGESEIDPKAILNSTIVNQANININTLYTLLQNAPDSLKPAIQKAIELSQMGYEIAINATQP